MSARIEIVGGPWSERIGCTGVTVDDPGDHVYPFDKRLPTDVVVRLDSDPLGCARGTWTCVIAKKHLRYLP